MAMKYWIDEARSRWIVRHTGMIAPSDVKTAVRAQIDAGVWTWETLIDTTGSTGIQAVSEDVPRVASLVNAEREVRDLPPRGPIVMVVSDLASDIAEMARAYQQITVANLGFRVAIVQHLDDVDEAFVQLRAT
jgi:hypothetical protein